MPRNNPNSESISGVHAFKAEERTPIASAASLTRTLGILRWGEDEWFGKGAEATSSL